MKPHPKTVQRAMSQPGREMPIPCRRSASEEFAMPCGSPSHHSLRLSEGMTSPIITRRTRTVSQSELAMQGPSFDGTVTSFCRERGHGWLKPDGEEEPIFLHVSDIEEEIVPKSGDRVTFKKTLIPPKNTKSQAVHVKITHATPETHDRWDTSPRKPLSDHQTHYH